MFPAPERALTFILSTTLFLTTLSLILLIGSHLGRPLANLIIHLLENFHVVPLPSLQGDPAVTKGEETESCPGCWSHVIAVCVDCGGDIRGGGLEWWCGEQDVTFSVRLCTTSSLLTE
ncbi:hypothetical protein EJ03DRAFT_331726 [Teratosphaeria nubilosa]|uniref:Uncharacterized protein n=1 Tax=Teratosphaeria nubilosa TaxID=161662 RepID=A0A6G1KW64_9PEZI|nr:hypothetical protein EJ03DRAFT_331726 [Teratosphaeria nubilosa]